ncbi:MAG: hypothetical protein Q7J57_16550 [Gemmobacter sp.]|nr:hypothetical protein [Gemmobacter sp.]
MTPKEFDFQPGAILHDAIVGTFRAHGGSFERWCQENGITPSTARNATFGQSRGPKGRALLGRIIDDAGRDFVRRAYAARIEAYASAVKRGAA